MTPVPPGLPVTVVADSLKIDWRHQRPGGHILYAEWTLVDSGPGCFAIVRDVSLRKQAKVVLLNAQNFAEQAAQRTSDFLANIRHEKHTPLNTVIGLTHLALKTEMTNRQRDYLEKIEKSDRYVLGIINDILDFSKIEAGKLSVERVADLAERLEARIKIGPPRDNLTDV